jgi:predicted permease
LAIGNSQSEALGIVFTLWQDIRYGSRALLKARAFTTVAVLTLALGIGVNAALFTVFDAFVLRPLPLKDPDRLVNLDGGTDAEGRRLRLFSYPDYLEYRDQSEVFSDLIAWNKVRATLGEAPPNQDDSSAFAEGYEYLFGQIVTGNYFTALGPEMILGRGLRPEDDQLASQQPAVVLSHAFWKRRFDSDTQIVGKTIVLQGQPFKVIGVTAPEFVGTTPDVPSFWAPLMTRDYLIQAGGWGHKRWFTDRNTEVFTLLGRLKPGVTRRQAEAATQIVTDRLAQIYPAKGRKTRVKLESAATFVTLDEDVMPLVIPLLLGFGLVLLIACANVANLLLARAAGRHREIGVRLALGASRWRVVRQLVSESLLLALAGGAVGLLFAVWTLSLLYPIILSSVPLPEGLADQFALNLTPDWRVFGFTLLAATVAGIAAGLVPALQASKPDLTSALKEEGSALHANLSQSRLRAALVVAQMAVCLSLLIGAGLLFKNMRHIQTLDTGMITKNVFAVAVGLSRTGNEKPDAAREIELRHELADRLRASPGVVAVSQAYRQPLSGEMGNTSVSLPEETSNHPREARFNFVSAEYFQTLSIPLVRGRAFTAEEVKAQSPFVVISEATAQRYWPGVEPLGKHIGIAATAPSTQDETSIRENDAPPVYRQYEVIGVARDVHSRWVWQKDESFIYVPSPAASPTGQYLLVRTQNDPAGTMGLVRGLATTIHPSLRVSVRRTEENLAFQTAPFRAVAWLSGVLGMLALLLASVGLYGVMTFVVARRTREIGIRVALGAKPVDVVRMFLFEGLRLTAIGMFLGIIGGVLISRLLATILIDLSPLDPVAFGSVSLFLALVAMLATYLPARRAARVDPLVALRCE